MSTEIEILSEVESLKAKFGDTRALYREVCALLFFRFGITPTANKLYPSRLSGKLICSRSWRHRRSTGYKPMAAGFCS